MVEEKDKQVFLHLKKERPWKKQGKKLTAQKICINKPTLSQMKQMRWQRIQFNQLVRNCTHAFLVEIPADNFNSIPTAELIPGDQGVETLQRSSRAPNTHPRALLQHQGLGSCAPPLLQSQDQEPRVLGLPGTCQHTVIQRDTGPQLLQCVSGEAGCAPAWRHDCRTVTTLFKALLFSPARQRYNSLPICPALLKQIRGWL